MSKNRWFLIVVAALLAGLLGAVVWGVVWLGEGVEVETPVARSGLQSLKGYATGNVTVSTSAITVSNTGFGWGSSDIADADVAYVSAHTAAVTVRWDGTSPTATLGLPLPANSTIKVEGNRNVRNLRFIRSGGSDAVVSVTLEKR